MQGTGLWIYGMSEKKKSHRMKWVLLKTEAHKKGGEDWVGWGLGIERAVVFTQGIGLKKKKVKRHSVNWGNLFLGCHR